MNWIRGNEISWFLNGALIAISAANRKLRSNCEATVAAITSESSIKSYTAWSVFTIIVLLCYLAAVPPLLYTRLENKPGIYMILFPPTSGKCSFSSLLTKAPSFNGHTRHWSFFLSTATSLNYIFPDDNARSLPVLVESLASRNPSIDFSILRIICNFYFAFND